MGEQFQSKTAPSFKHSADAAYEVTLKTSTLLSRCFRDVFASDFVCDLVGPQPPPVGTQVLIHWLTNGAIGVTQGHRLVGVLGGPEAARLRGPLAEVGGLLTGEVVRHASIGANFTIRVRDPRSE